MSDFRPYRWSAEKVTVNGLRYRVSLADHILRDQRGEAEASMFGFSYTACADDSRRPVLFAYNGGPGAASYWLHMGLLGPKLADAVTATASAGARTTIMPRLPTLMTTVSNSMTPASNTVGQRLRWPKGLIPPV